MKFSYSLLREIFAPAVICGTLFCGFATAQAQSASYSSLASLPGGDAAYGTMVEGNDGNLYVAGHTGIYRVSLGGAVTKIADLSGSSSPVEGNTYGNLVIGVDTWLYGNFSSGIYWIHTNATSLSQIYTYNNATASASNKSYTSMAGGGTGEGTVYTLLNDSANSYLYDLTSPGQGSLYCTIPDPKVSAVIQGSDGNIYGTTYDASGSKFFNCSGGTFKLLATFGNGSANDTDGSASYGPLVEGLDGDFYGTTQNLGLSSTPNGTIYKVTTGGQISVLHSFTGRTDGGMPTSGLLLASDGNFYGTAAIGGGGQGTLYRLSTGGTFTELLDFPSGVDVNYNGLVEAHDGNFYGATDSGDIYKITLAPALAPPVQMDFSAATIGLGQSATLTWSLKNANSMTANQCFATGGTGSGWGGSIASSGSLKVTPSAVGIFSFALSCGGVESNFATLTVVNATATLATATPNPVSAGANVKLTATVHETVGSGVPTGSVDFLYGSVSLGSSKLNASGVAAFTASTAGIPVGSYSVTANYAGDSDNASSTSSVVVMVAKASTSTALAVSPNPISANTSATLTATVQKISGSGAPTGSVTFSANGQALGKVALFHGVAVLTVSDSGIPPGTYTVTAAYAGDAADDGSTSTAVKVVVQ